MEKPLISEKKVGKEERVLLMPPNKFLS